MTEKEFTTKFMKHHRKMYAVALVIVCNEETATDIVQDAYVRLWKNRTSIATIDNTEAYCITVVKRLCIDNLRRRNRETAFEDCLSMPEPHDEGRLARSIEASDSLEYVGSLLSNLPERQRRVVELSAIAGMDNDEIASATGYGEANVRTLLCRGRKRLRELFGKE